MTHHSLAVPGIDLDASVVQWLKVALCTGMEIQTPNIFAIIQVNQPITLEYALHLEQIKHHGYTIPNNT